MLKNNLNQRCELGDNDNLSGVMSRNNALDSNGSHDCQGLNMHNFLNTCPNGAGEASIGMYKKSR